MIKLLFIINHSCYKIYPNEYQLSILFVFIFCIILLKLIALMKKKTLSFLMFLLVVVEMKMTAYPTITRSTLTDILNLIDKLIFK